jgi:hypothetical protein
MRLHCAGTFDASMSRFRTRMKSYFPAFFQGDRVAASTEASE